MSPNIGYGESEMQHYLPPLCTLPFLLMPFEDEMRLQREFMLTSLDT